MAYSGFVNNETAASALTGTLAYTGSSQGARNAGSYTITPGGLSANHGNYTLNYTNGTLTVNPATLTLTANAGSRTYGATNPGFTGTVTGFVNGETAATALSGTAAFTTNATSTSNVGSYAIDGSGLTANHGNYVFTQAAGNAGALTITPAALAVSAANASKTYDGQAFSGGNGVAYSGFVNNETAASALTGTLAYTGSSQGARNAGSYTITPGGLSANHGNYTLNYTNGTLTVNPATLTVSVTPAARVVGAANPAFNATVSGFVPGDSLGSATTGDLVFRTAAGLASLAGSYGVVADGLSANNGNYVFMQAAGNAQALAIEPVQAAPERVLPHLEPVPNFPDNALPALGSNPVMPGFGNLNFVALSGSVSPQEASTLPPAVLNQLVAPAGGVASAAPPVGLSVIAAAPAAVTTAPSPVAFAGGSPSTTVAPAAGGAVGGSAPVAPVASGSGATAAPVTTAGAGNSGGDPAGGPTVNGGTGGSGDGNTAGSGSPAPSRTAKLGAANIAVPSANGPLDIYVISGGINTGEPQRRTP